MAGFAMMVGIASVHAQVVKFQTSNEFSWTYPVEENRTYRTLFSADLQSWMPLGDLFLPSEQIPWKLPEGEQGFIQLIPDIPLGDIEPRIVLLGDSTMADLSILSIQFHGWGQHFSDFFNDQVTIVNQAETSLGTVEYFSRNKFQQLSLVQPDFVIMQFGHIEEKNNISAEVFESNLATIVDEIRSINAIPILVTPAAIRRFDAEDNHINDLADERESLLKVAREKHTQYIDLNKRSAALYDRVGNTASTFITVCGNECDDLSHFSRTGSYVISSFVAEELPGILQTFRKPLDGLIGTIDAAFETDRRFSSLSVPFVELTGFEDEQIWEWVYPEGTIPLP